MAMQEQASVSGQNVADVVAERWGSLENLTTSLTQGRAAPGGWQWGTGKGSSRAAPYRGMQRETGGTEGG